MEVADSPYLETTNSPDLLQFLIFFTPPAQPVFSVDTNISLSDGRLLNMLSQATTGFISETFLILKCRGTAWGGRFLVKYTNLPCTTDCLLRHTNTEPKVTGQRLRV